MLHFIHHKKLVASLALGLGALAVGSLWMDDRSVTDSEGEGLRSSRRSINYRDGDTESIARRPARRASAPASSDPGPDAPRSIQRSNGADRNIIARGSGDKSTAQGVKRSSRAGNARGARNSNRLTLSLGASSLSVRQRVANLEALANNPLSEEELEDAYNFLATTPNIEGVSASSKHWIVDELITALRQNGVDNNELTSELAAVYQNNDDMIIRDYALQHLGHLRSEGGNIELIDNTLTAAASEQTGTIAGTALLALNAQSSNDVALVNTTQQQALTVASTASYDLRSRISALQVAGQQGAGDIIPLATNIAASNAEPTTLRMAAIATLADLEAADQHAMLYSLTKSTDLRIRTAATAAVEKLALANEE